jgi:hypothetical protein
MHVVQGFRIMAIAACVGLTPWRAAAQSVAAPMAVAQQYLDAVRTGKWEAVLQLTDAKSIREWAAATRRNRAPQKLREPEPETVETMMRADSTLPRAVAEYFVAQRSRYVKLPEAGLAMEFADVRTQAEFDALPDAELFTRHLRAKSFEYLYTMMVKQLECKLSPQLPAAGADDLLGVALLRNEEAIALYIPSSFHQKSPLDEGEMEFLMRRLRLRKTEAGWRVLANSSNEFGGAGFAIGLEGPGCANK